MPMEMLDAVAAAFDAAGLFTMFVSGDSLTEKDKRRALEAVLFVCTADRFFSKSEAAHLSGRAWMPAGEPEELDKIIEDTVAELIAKDAEARLAYAEDIAKALTDKPKVRRETLVAASVAANVDPRGADKQREAYQQLVRFAGEDAASIDDEAQKRLGASA